MQDFMDFFHTEHNCIDYLFNVKDHVPFLVEIPC